MAKILLVALTLALTVSAAHAASLAGATLPDTLKVGETNLTLNGLGLRKKAMFQVYVADSTSHRSPRTAP